MKPKSIAVAFVLALGAFSFACAGPNLCERKENFLANRCVGGDVTWSPDPSCERKIERCSPGQLAAMEGYVSCLEAQGVCSLDAMARCAEAYPGGVNLLCG